MPYHWPLTKHHPPLDDAAFIQLESIHSMATERPSVDLLDTVTVVAHWVNQPARGALKANELTSWLQTVQQQIHHVSPQWVILHMSSAGADVFHPFESLGGINEMITQLNTWKRLYGFRVTGVLEDKGTYGGASLVLASVCDDIVSSQASQWRLLGG